MDSTFGDFFGKYSEWEKNKKVYVYGTAGVEPHNVVKTVKIIGDVIKEFNLPLEVLNGNATKNEDVPIIENLIANNTQQNLIDFDNVQSGLDHQRKKGLFPYRLIVLVNPKQYEIKKPPECEEHPDYGLASLNLIILREFNNENAARHEFGHMIRLEKHHRDCVMDWECSIDKFCEDCRKRIAEIKALLLKL